MQGGVFKFFLVPGFGVEDWGLRDQGSRNRFSCFIYAFLCFWLIFYGSGFVV